MKTRRSWSEVLRIGLVGIVCLTAAALVVIERREKSLVVPLSLSFSPDGRQLLVGYGVGGPRLWDLSEDRPQPVPLSLPDVKSHWTWPDDVRFVARGVLAAFRRSVSRDIPDEVVVWDAASDRPARVVCLPYCGHSHFAENSPIAVASAGDPLRAPLALFDLETGVPLGSLPQSESVPGARCNDFAISANGGRVIASYSRHRSPVILKVWDTASRSLVQSFPIESGCRLALSADGQFVADGITAIWDAEKGEKLATFEGIGFPYRSTAISPDGKMLAIGSYHGLVVVWDATTGKRLESLFCGAWQRTEVAFSPDGSILAAGAGGALRLWDTADFRRDRTLRADGRAMAIVLFTAAFSGCAVAWGLLSRRVARRRREHGVNPSGDAPRLPWFSRLAWTLLGTSGVVTLVSSLVDVFTIIYSCTPFWFVYLGYYGVVAGTFALTQAVGRSRTWLCPAAALELPCFFNGHLVGVVLAAVVCIQTLWTCRRTLSGGETVPRPEGEDHA